MAQHNESGKKAEAEVVSYLRSKKYKIIDTNWKTSWCEIDIVAEKDSCLHFVEVKYRSSNSQGGGYEYINTRKQQQMARAAESWVLINNWADEYVLSAAEVSGDSYYINFIEDINQ